MIVLIVLSGVVLANETYGTTSSREQGISNLPSSVVEVVRTIRRTTSWQILNIQPSKSSDQNRYRFKLINSSGKVMIIRIDPEKPNLKKLGQ